MIIFILLKCLLITVLTEGLFIFALFRRWQYVYYSILCNLLTNPPFNLLLLLGVSLFSSTAYYPILIIGEIAVVFIEAFVYRYICRFSWLKSSLLSFTLNLASFAAGLAAF